MSHKTNYFCLLCLIFSCRIFFDSFTYAQDYNTNMYTLFPSFVWACMHVCGTKSMSYIVLSEPNFCNTNIFDEYVLLSINIKIYSISHLMFGKNVDSFMLNNFKLIYMKINDENWENFLLVYCNKSFVIWKWSYIYVIHEKIKFYTWK